MRLLLLIGLVMGAVGWVVSLTESEPAHAEVPVMQAAQREDDEDVRALMKQLQDAWRARDIDGFLAHVLKDAELVNRYGMWVRGRTAIGEHLKKLRETAVRSNPEIASAKATIEAVDLIPPRVALVFEQRKESHRTAFSTYVLMKQDRKWWVRSVSITEVSGAVPEGRDH